MFFSWGAGCAPQAPATRTSPGLGYCELVCGAVGGVIMWQNIRLSFRFFAE